ncbi:MAG: hypothetical protein LBG61_00615 [Burkholderiales bacterium]|jgi:hypothetical protein|nr:hypothetical protein [Burkholderiales bacterium]
MEEVITINKKINIESLEKSLVELQQMKRLEETNLLNAGSDKQQIEQFIVKLNNLIAETEERIRSLTSE